MRTSLEQADLGPISIVAPASTPRHVVARHGHLWQWVGDGAELMSLSVAVRRTRLGTQAGVRHHLGWEVEQVRSGMAAEAEGHRVADVPVHVAGATGAAAADVAGRMHETDLLNRLVVTTDGHHMHVVRVLVPDTAPGRALTQAVTSALQVRPWVIPT